MEIDSSELEAKFELLGKQEAMEAANRAFSSSQERLTKVGDSRGYEVFPVVQSGTPPVWDETENAARFEYSHPAAYYFEVGTQTHEIVADDGMLAFEWPDAPPEVQDMFESTFPTVFFKSVEVEGIDRIDFVKQGLEDARDWLEGR
ncbi:hypothetical protein EGH21_22565 [Halomicroarcula sp. F13]|uniref:HK97 gp10 family phage protein n=1 Tax=Haloarcula rubra TaxID=2487747 RepID=A0AAW4PZ35_9EURY|nr:hypothetical protein [Halomicroarcula rubra]MBX0325805.1 hypothetical protein [Halomicroarcula rubra]